MVLNNSYQYDVFISYKREDYEWARKLYKSLQDRRLKPFLDTERLQAGEQWEPQLAANLRGSQHLVVLWSKKVAQSQWVNREIYTFDGIRNMESVPIKRRMLFVLLEDGADPPFSSLQMIDDLRQTNAYAAGINQVDSDLWTRIVDKIDTVVREDDVYRPVPLAIIAMTRQRLDQLDPAALFPISFPDGQKNLSMLLTELDIVSMKTKDDLAQYYGHQASDWRPFGSAQSIWTIMQALKNEINNFLLDAPIRWDPISNDLWSGDLVVTEAAAKRLRDGWSVIVIDPLSLYDNNMYRIFAEFITPALENPKAVFMTLPPFDLLKPYAYFRVITKLTVRRVFEHFYDPSLTNFQLRAKCSVNIGDQRDIRQWLLTTVGLGVQAELPGTTHPVLRA